MAAMTPDNSRDPDVSTLVSADVVLNDGSTVHLRQLEPRDAPALQRFHARQSPESQYFRYFSAKSTLSDAEAIKFCRIDETERGALLVEDGEEIAAWASFERLTGRDDAEVAFHVDDAHGGRGIATILLEYLGAMAAPLGIRRFTATVMADNRAMRVVFAHAGWPIEREFDGGLVDFTWPIQDTPEFLATTAKREQIADSRSMARLLLASTVAAIGASDKAGSVGRVMFEHLLASTPAAQIFAVNPAHSAVLGYPCVASVDEVEADIALAVIAVPQAALRNVLAACARRRVRGAVILTEVDEMFPMSEAVAEARRYGMRIIGPGSMGIAHLSARQTLHAHLAPTSISHGPLAISLQAGSLGASVLERATRLGVGISSFVSLGAKADVSGNDLLQFWEDDAATRVIAMYTESFGNPRRFARIARRVGMTRPIVAVRPGGDSTIHDALYQQAGVIRVDTVAEMLDTARLLALQPLAKGRRVAVVTNSASPTRLLLASLRAQGLQPVDQHGSPGGWQQLDWSVGPASIADAAEARREDDTCDAVIALYAPPVAHRLDAFVADFGQRHTQHPNVPVIGVFLGMEDGPLWPGSDIPNFSFPDDAARVLGRTVRYSDWRTLMHSATESADDPETLDDRSLSPAEPNPNHGRIRALIDNTLEAHPDGTELAPNDVVALLEKLQIAQATTRLATDADEAVAAAHEIGYPVVLKTLPRLTRGRGRDAGVALELRSEAALRGAWAEFFGTTAHDPAAIVQAMVTPGVDVRIYGRTEPGLGPVISAGLGGAFAGRLDEHSVRLVPVDPHESAEVVSAALTDQHLDSLDDAVRSAVDIVATVSQALDLYPEILEIDLNPVILSPAGCWVTDAHIRVGPSSKPDSPMRHLN